MVQIISFSVHCLPPSLEFEFHQSKNLDTAAHTPWKHTCTEYWPNRYSLNEWMYSSWMKEWKFAKLIGLVFINEAHTLLFQEVSAAVHGVVIIKRTAEVVTPRNKSFPRDGFACFRCQWTSIFAVLCLRRLWGQGSMMDLKNLSCSCGIYYLVAV